MKNRPSRGLLAFTAVAATVAWSAAAIAWRTGGRVGLAVSLIGLGASLGPCLAGYALARTERKQAWRKAVLATGGLSILAFSFVERTGLDLESFLSLLILGTMGAAIGHTVVTTILGPLVFGRLLCGWGCWRSMVLELLPAFKGTGRRRRGWWRVLPMVGLGLCGAAALAASWGSHPRGSPPLDGLVPVAVAVATYYALAVAFALALRDHRAFCKYLCPTGQVLRWTSARSLFAIRAQAGGCTECGACSAACPMDIGVSAIARRGGRIGGGECILCQRCVESCPSGVLGYRRRSFQRGSLR